MVYIGQLGAELDVGSRRSEVSCGGGKVKSERAMRLYAGRERLRPRFDLGGASVKPCEHLKNAL